MTRTQRIRGTTAHTDALAIELRHKQTPVEDVLWQQLRNRQAAGLKFRRQHPIGPFIVDFYCAEHQLAVELDGTSHQQRQQYDEERTAWLNANQVRVIRFPNKDVVIRSHWVVQQIIKAANRSPLPCTGEGSGVRADAETRPEISTKINYSATTESKTRD